VSGLAFLAVYTVHYTWLGENDTEMRTGVTI
jgi:hypothetical protein